MIFDESRGNIDRVQIEIVNRDTICSYIAEDMAPNVMSWKRDEGDFLAAIDDLRPKASLKCPKNKIISRVEFASFGNPVGVCGYFLLGNCTYPDTQKIVEQVRKLNIVEIFFARSIIYGSCQVLTLFLISSSIV